MEKKNEKQTLGSPEKLKLLITVVNRVKSEYYADLIQSFGVNMQLFVSAQGTAKTQALEYLGLNDDRKSVMIGAVRADRADEILSALDERFKTIKNGKGIAFTIPMSSVIGVSAYRFLADSREDNRLL
jgi:hypothetical protein